MLLLIEQLLNGLQLGVMLFLMASGLTLVFGDDVRLEITAGCDPGLLGQVIDVLRGHAAP